MSDIESVEDIIRQALGDMEKLAYSTGVAENWAVQEYRFDELKNLLRIVIPLVLQVEEENRTDADRAALLQILVKLMGFPYVLGRVDERRGKENLT